MMDAKINKLDTIFLRSTVTNQTKQTISETDVTTLAPITLVNSPTTMVSYPTTTVNSPTTMVSYPTTTVNSPTTMVNYPTTTVNSPTTTVNYPTTTVNYPTTTLADTPLQFHIGPSTAMTMAARWYDHTTLVTQAR